MLRFLASKTATLIGLFLIMAGLGCMVLPFIGDKMICTILFVLGGVFAALGESLLTPGPGA